MFKHVLVPLDAGSANDAMVKRACSFAQETGARLTFYHAKPSFFPPMAGEDFMVDVSVQKIYADSMVQRAANILSRAQAIAQEYTVSFDVLSNECEAPYEGIIAAARDKNCDLIFMSSHGRSGVVSLLLGSETQKVLTHCTIPVLVYR